MRAKQNPCYKCHVHTESCHSTCEEYTAWADMPDITKEGSEKDRLHRDYLYQRQPMKRRRNHNVEER